MKIDFATLAFGYRVKVGGGTPNWATALGQGSEYKINNSPAIDEILKGIVYSAVPLDKISTRIGKGGKVVTGNSNGSPIILGAMFSKVLVNDIIIPNGKFVLLITRDDSDSHAGRLRLKYGPSNSYVENGQSYSNQDLFEQIKNQLSLASDACWFVSNIRIIKQNELVLKVSVVDPQGPVEYEDSSSLHSAWNAFEVADEEEFDAIEVEEESMEMLNRQPRTHKTHNFNCILYGAPGTGKTYSTIEYAVDVCNDKITDFKPLTQEIRKKYKEQYDNLVSQGRIVFTTFHQSFGYEDFIQGLRPDTKADTMKFDTVDGVFKNIADKAMMDTENDYVIIIDEINRGNISKIFGELITLIEDDKRWGEANQLSVMLPSGQKFAVPNNIYIIGTMNSADKSISLIDTALRRRFAFIEKAPDASIISNEKIKNVLIKLNGYIKNELRSTDLLIGHAFFINKDENDLEEIMNNHIIPLLYEYFFDDENKVKKALDCLSDTICEIDKSYPGRIRVKVKA